MRRIAALVLAFASPVHADTLVDHVDGLTIDTHGNVERFSGMVIDGEGKVIRLLGREDKRPAKIDYLIDGKGRVLLPGMIDSHVRLMDLGLAGLMCDLSAAKSPQEAEARIIAYAAANSDRPWIMASGWNAMEWGMPDLAAREGVIDGHPLLVLDQTGEAGWANAVALKLAGLARAPGRPIETLRGPALEAMRKAAPRPRPEDLDLALDQAQTLLLSRGITAVADMGTTIEAWQAYRRAGDAGALRLRIMAYAEGIEAMELIGGPGPTPWLYEDRLRLNGVTFALDGAIGSHMALLKAPYADRPATSGVAVIGDTQLRNLMSRAALDRFQIAVRAIGDKANADALTAFGELAQTYKGDRRWRIEKALLVDPADFARFGQAGVIASMQPGNLPAGMKSFEPRIGSQRLVGIHAWRSLARAGTVLAFGSGAPAHGPDPFGAIAVAITRQNEAAQPFGGWQAEERLTREAALAAWTANAAWTGFAEGRFGRLAKGERADFLFVDRDPLLASPADLRQIKVQEVWIAGRRVMPGPNN